MGVGGSVCWSDYRDVFYQAGSSYGVTFGFSDGPDMGYYNGFFVGSNDVKPVG